MNRKKENVFVLKGCAGLGNRLITLSWAIQFAIQTKRLLVVDWTDGLFGPKGGNIFFDYFELKNIPFQETLDFQSGSESSSFYPPIWKKYPKHSVYDLYEEGYQLSRFYRYFLRIGSFGRWRITSPWSLRSQYFPDTGFSPTSIALRPLATGRFMPLASEYPTNISADFLFGADFVPPFNSKTLNQHLIFRTDFAARLKNCALEMGIGKNTIGIHVRLTDRGDEERTIRLASIIREQLKNRDQNIFLATDNKKVVSLLKSSLSRIITYPKFLPEPGKVGLHQWALYNSQSSQAHLIFEESLIDLYLLSCCGEFYYQGDSSYSLIARHFADSSQRAINWCSLVL